MCTEVWWWRNSKIYYRFSLFVLGNAFKVYIMSNSYYIACKGHQLTSWPKKDNSKTVLRFLVLSSNASLAVAPV